MFSSAPCLPGYPPGLPGGRGAAARRPCFALLLCGGSFSKFTVKLLALVLLSA